MKIFKYHFDLLWFYNLFGTRIFYVGEIYLAAAKETKDGLRINSLLRNLRKHKYIKYIKKEDAKKLVKNYKGQRIYQQISDFGLETVNLLLANQKELTKFLLIKGTQNILESSRIKSERQAPCESVQKV